MAQSGETHEVPRLKSTEIADLRKEVADLKAELDKREAEVKVIIPLVMEVLRAQSQADTIQSKLETSRAALLQAMATVELPQNGA